MSWHYLQELGGGSLEDCCTGGERLQPLKSKTTHAEFYCKGKLTESYLNSLSGTTFAPSTENPGEDELTSYQEDFPVRILALPEMSWENEKDWTGTGLGYGLKCLGLLAKYDPDTYSWKTVQHSLFGDLEEFSGIWPRWGSLVNGECWELTTPEPHTDGTASGSWPTPTKSDATRGPTTPERNALKLGGISLVSAVRHRPTIVPQAGGRVNPEWCEWLMGFPMGWTDLQPLEMRKYQEWLKSPWKSWEEV